MTQPTAPPPPETVGTAPRSASEINGLIGTHLRGFTASKATIGQDKSWLETVNLKDPPYYFAQEQEDLIKSCINELDTVLDTINMTLISRIIGM